MYAIALPDGRTVQASLRGRLKQTGSPVVIGDRVRVSEAGEGAWTIEAVEPRAAELVRRGRGGRAPKVLAANLDRVFAVLALRDPPATHELVDRLLVMIEASGIHPHLVLNKVDVQGAAEGAAELADLYDRIGYRTFVVSARTGEGLGLLREVICHGSSALIGPSGVGKSSLLNALDPELELRTAEVSGKTGTGRHTTVSSRMISLECGGTVADTPGFSEVALWGIAPGEVASCFPELSEPASDCRFRNCTHVREPGCGVQSALTEGGVEESRYRSYVKLFGEAVEAESV